MQALRLSSEAFAGRVPARGVLARYVTAAAAARTAVEGMAPALALLVAAAGRQPALAGALLAAAGLPHVVAGPFAGAALDATPRRRAVLALAPAVFAVVLAGAAVGIGSAPDALCILLVLAAGCAGPLLTGGLSAELTRLVPARRGRAQALDGASYNIAGIAGPALIAGCAALAGARTAALCLAALAAGAAALVLLLPASPHSGGERRAGLDGARRLWRARPLRRVTAGTSLAFLGAGALPLLVIARAGELGATTTGAALLAVMAGSALLGSLAAAALGESARPERRVRSALLGVAAALGLAAAAPGTPALGAALALTGFADGLLLPAILAVRTRHSPAAERGAVFMTAASLKVAAGAAGAGLGGLVVATAGAGPALLAAAGLHVAGAVVCLPQRGSS